MDFKFLIYTPKNIYLKKKIIFFEDGELVICALVIPFDMSVSYSILHLDTEFQVNLSNKLQ